MLNYVLLFCFLWGCGTTEKITHEFHMVDNARCPNATPELLEYAESSAEDFFGDREFANDVYINDNLQVEGYWFPNGIAILCGTTQEICNRLMHEYGHGAAYARWKDPDRDHTRLVVYWDYWYTYPCIPSVMEENGFENVPQEEVRVVSQ